MNLIHLRYEKDQSSKLHTILYLGEQDDKIIGLEENHILIDEINFIRERLSDPQINIVEWIKENIPSYKSAYRTFFKKQVTILQIHEIKPLKK